jgi:vacuolar-type H+-ATPase subunit C/Vma6
LKSVLIALAGKERAAPEWTPLERFGTVRFEAYPDLNAMLKNTEFEFLLNDASKPAGVAKGGGLDSIRTQTRLDRYYYTALRESLFKLPKRDREGIGEILEEEISLRNTAWALRLRTYYRMEAADVKDHLVVIEKGKGKTLADDALASLELPLDFRDAWGKWRRRDLLNDAPPGEAWAADPRYFQNAASARLYRMARFYFRRHPLSMDAPACFIKLKQYEEDLLTSMAEGLGLGIPIREIFSFLEVKA